MRHFCLAAVAALVFAAAAYGDDVPVPLTVRPGPLALAPVTVLARDARANLTVVDARGRGAGWTLLARSAGPARAVVVIGVDARCGARSTCTLPHTRVHYPVLLSSVRLVPVLDAQRGTGMGMIVITLRLGTHSPGGAAVRFAVRPS